MAGAIGCLTFKSTQVDGPIVVENGHEPYVILGILPFITVKINL
jgi:hypothetical protein